MLLELRIGNLALVDELDLGLGPGLTMLTGETGAGKSLLAGALGLLAGRRAAREAVRLGEETAWVEGVFDLSQRPRTRAHLARAGVRTGPDGILVLRRELRRRGRGRVLVNGTVSSQVLLRRIGRRLLSIQSQDQQRELTSAGFALRLLDELAGCGELRRAVARAWQDWRDRDAALGAAEREDALAREQLDIWRYQHRELHDAGLREGEEEELAELLAVRRHAGALQEGAARALAALDEEPGDARSALGRAVGALRAVSRHSRRLEEVARTLAAAEEGLADASLELGRFLDGLELDPGELDSLQERKTLYEELRRKYGLDTPGLLDLRDRLGERLERREGADRRLDELREAAEAARVTLQEAAAGLRRRRRRQAGRAAALVQDAVRPLALPDLEAGFAIVPREDDQGPIELDGSRCAVTGEGAERVELHVRTNPGEGRGPVGAIASGGERSRIYLGLVALLRRRAEPPLLLLDEADAGLGMDAAAPVASRLAALAEAGQVVCITHLPTMAVRGRFHLKVEKAVASGRTRVRVRDLAGRDRVAEVARLLGGEGYGGGDRQAQVSYAEELLAAGLGAGRAARAGQEGG